MVNNSFDFRWEVIVLSISEHHTHNYLSVNDYKIHFCVISINT